MIAWLLAAWAGPVGKFVKTFWPYIVAAIAALLVLWWAHHRGYASGYADATEEADLYKAKVAAAYVDGVKALNQQVAARDQMLEQKETAYVEAARKLAEAQRTTPPRVVRVCVATRPAGPATVSGIPGAAAGDAHQPGGSGFVSGRAESAAGSGGDTTSFDLGPGLKHLVDRAEDLKLKCLAQQERTDSLSATQTSPR